MPKDKTIQGIMEFVRGMGDVDHQAVRDALECWRLHRQAEQAIENDLADWGLTPRQIEVLEVLYYDGSATPAGLSDDVGLTRSAMTSALDSLERLGHVARSPHPSDRRMIAVSLTPSGRQFLEERLPQRYRHINRIIGYLSVQERQLMIRVYAKILDVLSREHAGGN